jgi:hypothetical protein
MLISITAISLVGILSEALLTEGQTKKYIQGILALAVVLVFLTSATSLIKGNQSVNDYLDITYQEPVSTSSDTLNKIELYRYSLAEKNIETLIEKKGIKDVFITFSYGYNEEGNVFVQNIYADTLSAVIITENGNININEKIVDACRSVVDIGKEGIIIDGKIATE